MEMMPLMSSATTVCMSLLCAGDSMSIRRDMRFSLDSHYVS